MSKKESDLRCDSDPIFVENQIYRLQLWPNRLGSSRETHISVGLQRFSFEHFERFGRTPVQHCLIRMLHSYDSDRDFIWDKGFEFESEHVSQVLIDEFYEEEDLAVDGFIHSDGSVRFEFCVKKQNYARRLEQAQATERKLRIQIELDSRVIEQHRCEIHKAQQRIAQLEGELASANSEAQHREIAKLRQALLAIRQVTEQACHSK